MDKKEQIREELTELLNEYYNGSFSQMACDYIRSTGMTLEEMERMLEEIRKGQNLQKPRLMFRNNENGKRG